MYTDLESCHLDVQKTSIVAIAKEKQKHMYKLNKLSESIWSFEHQTILAWLIELIK